MEISFWGTRGSIPKPGPNTLRYGGNTSCVEVRSADGQLIVLDCGTGANNLGQALTSSATQPLRGSILITHTHWDHIQGIPFFAPLFVPDNEWDIYAPHGLSESLRETLAGQMQYAYFPITLEALGATIRYHDLVEGSFEIGSVRVYAQYLNHPAVTLGYRLEADGVSVVYACDHECISRQAIPRPNDLNGRERHHVEFLRDADLVIHDAQFTAAEYPSKIGWGHSSVEYAIAVCRAAGARKLALTHHDPNRRDDNLDQIVVEARSAVKASGSPLDVCAAAEGNTIKMDPAPEPNVSAGRSTFLGTTAIDLAVKSHFIAMSAVRPAAETVIRAAAAAEKLPISTEPSFERMLADPESDLPSLLVLDSETGATELGRIRQFISQKGEGAAQTPPVLIVANEAHDPGEPSELIADWLIWPFSEQYARTKIRKCVLREKCRWLRAKLPANEAERLAELHRLGILDTEPDERFDRITRIASEAFEVPIALVSLVDRDRQWFKSCVGLEIRESSRELAFCAHAILEEEPLVVADTLQDPRFADNPLVTEGLRIRFYAGSPLKSPNGLVLGTLCLVDTQPRAFGRRQINLLKDLANLAERELSAEKF